MIKIPREETEFVTPEGLLSFLFLMPGQAQPSFNAGSFAYKAELGCQIRGRVAQVDAYGRRVDNVDLTNCDQIVKCVAKVAQTMDPNNWQRHVFGPSGRLKQLEETDRDISKYPYYQGLYVLTFSQVHNLTTLGMKDANLSDPAVRQRFDQALNAKAPGAVRFANPNDPADTDRVNQLNTERITRGLPAYQDYSRVLLPVMAHEIWAGCYGRISGRAYWNAHAKPATVHLALNYVLLTRQGDRIVGDRSPDNAFDGFAPAASLAPAGFVPPQQQPPPPPSGLAGLL